MAEQLVSELEDDWQPDAFHDEFREKLEQLVQEKVQAGQGEYVMKPLEGEEVKTSADIIDLTELLRRSLRKGAGKPAQEENETQGKAAPRSSRREAANDEETPARPRRAAAAKGGARASTSVKPKPRKKAA
jgi:DNA end-binding protein Ku